MRGQEETKLLKGMLSSLLLSLSLFMVPAVAVHYTIINDLVGSYFKYSITVNVPKGSVLLAVLEAAQRAKPSEFR